MRKSRIIEEWREEGRVEGRQEGRVEGRQEGRVEGRQEGRVEGRQEAYRGILLRMLQKRFPGASSSAEVVAAVQTQTDADELMRWLELIDNVESLEAFRTAINA